MSDIQRLTRMIREAVEASGSRDPRAVAERVMEQMDPDFVEAALAVTLPGFVRLVMMENRPAVSTFAPVPPAPLPVPAPPSPVPAAPAPTPGFRPPSEGPITWGPPQPVPTGKPTHRPTGGARTQGFHGGARYREGWQRVLESHIVGAGGARKKLRECTPADLDAIASRLDKQADDAAAKARRYREVARVMRENSADTVDELPIQTKMNLFGQAA